MFARQYNSHFRSQQWKPTILNCFWISTLCASLLTSLPQSTCLIKFSPEFRVVSIKGVTFGLQKFKMQKTKKKNNNNNNNDTQIQAVLYCGNKGGRPLPQAIADLRKSEP